MTTYLSFKKPAKVKYIRGTTFEQYTFSPILKVSQYEIDVGEIIEKNSETIRIQYFIFAPDNTFIDSFIESNDKNRIISTAQKIIKLYEKHYGNKKSRTRNKRSRTSTSCSRIHISR